MTYVSCSIPEQFVNPLFEVFEGGDFILSSYRGIEEDFTRMRIFLEDPRRAEDAKRCLKAAMDIVGVSAPIETLYMPDEDWKLAYRRHFKIDEIGRHLVIVPEWDIKTFEASPSPGRHAIVLDPGMAFGTGKHETTRACLEYIDELALEMAVGRESAGGRHSSFLDMGCGSGILSIAAAKLGYAPVKGFDVDQEAVDAASENAAKNKVSVEYAKFALGRREKGSKISRASGSTTRFDLVAANILGPLLIRFADEIVPYVGRRIIISGILTELYTEVLKAYESRGFEEVSRKTLGEWTTGLLARTMASM